MPCPLSAVPSPVVALAGWCPLSPTDAQNPQLLVEPPWTPAVLWDRVTLTCQGSGTSGATSWYKNGQRWGQEGRDGFTVTETDNYQCDRPGTRRSSPVRVLNEGKEPETASGGTEVSLSPVRVHQSGRYRCRGLVRFWERDESAPDTGTVQSEHPTAPPHGLADTNAPPISFPELMPFLVLEGPPELTEGSPFNLSCLSTPSPLRPPAPLRYRFYRDGELVGGPQGSPQLLVPAVGVSHSGNYSCEVRSEGGAMRKSSARLGVTVSRVPLSGVSLSVQPPGGQVALGDRLVLSCAVAMGTGPLSLSWHRVNSAESLGSGPRLELRPAGDNDSGHYQCRVSDGDSLAESPALNVTVLVERARGQCHHHPRSPPALQVRPGDPVTMRCSVQVGSAPVTFTWLRHGQEVARGPLLELGAVDVGHSGTYQCVATNQLGQDGYRVFRALSPELALEVTPQGHWVTVAVNVGRTLLYLLLLLAVIGGCRWWHRRGG
ncbi:hypothetical protein Nmel_018699 [Mimus melanotis]